MDDVEPVDGLGEPQVGVDAGDHDARVDGQDLDPTVLPQRKRPLDARRTARPGPES